MSYEDLLCELTKLKDAGHPMSLPAIASYEGESNPQIYILRIERLQHFYQSPTLILKRPERNEPDPR